jgi:hypothetical protein
LEGLSFDAETVRIMGEAYDAARRELQDYGQPALVNEILAKRIIDIADKGERDPKKLARRALQELGVPR